MTQDSSAVLVTLMRLEQSVTAKLHEIEVRLAMLEQRVQTLEVRGTEDLRVMSAGVDAKLDVLATSVERQLEVVRAEARRDTALLVSEIGKARDR